MQCQSLSSDYSLLMNVFVPNSSTSCNSLCFSGITTALPEVIPIKIKKGRIHLLISVYFNVTEDMEREREKEKKKKPTENVTLWLDMILNFFLS